MMRRLYIASTVAFWLAVFGFWAADPRLAAEAQPPAPAGAERSWSLADMARHATPEDCWMAIDGVVYDFTAYLPQHPSAPAVIVAWCGREATEAYRTKTRGRPHSAYADQLLPEYRVGRLEAP